LGRFDGESNERLLGNRPARQDGNPVLTAIVVERLPERDAESSALGQHARLVNVPRSTSPAIDLLEKHDVCTRRADEISDALEVVDPSCVSAGVDVVHEHAQLARACGRRAGTRKEYPESQCRGCGVPTPHG
jgi:hypothetical protein